MQSQPNQSRQFTQSELQQLKAVLSRNIRGFEARAEGAKADAQFYKSRGNKENKDICFYFMQVNINKAKKLAKLQKKVKNLISGKEFV